MEHEKERYNKTELAEFRQIIMDKLAIARREFEILRNALKQESERGGDGNRSLNFEDGWVWIQKDKNGRVINPYELLPSLFEGVSEEDKELFITHEHLADGGAALSAFGKMQFTDITKLEHSKIVAGLLKYCELDTLAMVMIYEFWLDEIGLL